MEKGKSLRVQKLEAEIQSLHNKLSSASTLAKRMGDLYDELYRDFNILDAQYAALQTNFQILSGVKIEELLKKLHECNQALSDMQDGTAPLQEDL